MEVHVADHYRLWMWLLLPLTLGVGSAVLWLRARQWPRRIDRQGLLQRSGRLVLWSDIDRLGIVKHGFDETVRIDLFIGPGVTRIPIRSLADGAEVAAIIRDHYRRAKDNAG